LTNFLIITSTEDIASMNIRERFLGDNLIKFKEAETKWHNNPLYKLEMVTAKKDWAPFFVNNNLYLGLTDAPLIHLNNLKVSKAGINPDLLIFASRHRSETARPAFLVHTTGNLGDKAEFGGNPREISKSSALLLRTAYNSLKFQRSIKEMQDFELDIEVTHHGPSTLEKPLVFMELGSSEQEWKIDKAAKLVAHAILNTCIEYTEALEKKLPIMCIGFGGTHYAPQFKKLISNKFVAISFICAKYHIQNLDKSMIEQMISNNLEPIDYFVIDWKGTNSADKKHLIPLLEEFNIPIKKSKEF
jgi:D-aminoacyl-tRNA deacylase